VSHFDTLAGLEARARRRLAEAQRDVDQLGQIRVALEAATDRPAQRPPGVFEALVGRTLDKSPGMTVAELRRATGATKKTLQRVLIRLATAGRAEHTGSGVRGDPFRWHLTRANGQVPVAIAEVVEESEAPAPAPPPRPPPRVRGALDEQIGAAVVERVERAICDATHPLAIVDVKKRTSATHEAAITALALLEHRGRVVYDDGYWRLGST